ncbi:hypothetical protein [Mammaliicoccus sp. J-M40]|uniref:hypothetical protein n=1 Tax=Mammaliicoccus sp. J-M40 TaxID=2898699 RepID=UPI001EFA2E68|nr:hypothetical protein [Mammaliicoccus sp. J-M40]
MPTIKYTREDITRLENERDQYKAERDELSNKLDKECNDNYKLEGQLHDMTKQRDSLIKDVEKLREEIEELKKYNYELELAVDSDLKQQVDKWFEEWHDTKVENDLLELKLQEMKEDYRIVNSKYTNLTEHIKDKAIHNPGVHRYIDLVHVIDELERDTDER